MTFLEAYAIHGPDVEAIAKLLGISPPEADRQLNEEMNRRYEERKRGKKRSYHHAYNLFYRSQLREIRAGRDA